MEKARTTVDSFPIYKELFVQYALLALLAILLELVFNWFIIRRLPC
jgi:Ca-activated chloride channel family protein